MASKKGRKDRYVYRREDGAWVNQREGAERASSLHRTQKEAVDRAKSQAQRDGAELTVAGRDGKIRSKDSYGNDPNPPKDTEH